MIIFHPVLKKLFLCCLCLITGIYPIFSANKDNELKKEYVLGNEYYMYESSKGESIYGIAKKFGWDVEEVKRLNPNLKSILSKGTKIYYPISGNEISEERDEEKDATNETIIHTVKKGETIYSISRQYDVPLDVLYESNPSAKLGIKKGENLIIPLSAKNIVKMAHPDLTQGKNEKENSQNNIILASDNEEPIEMPEYDEDLLPNKSPDEELGFIEIIENNDTVLENFIHNEEIDQIRIAIILDDPNSKKDIEFVRGFLVALYKFKEFPKKIDLKVLDGRIATNSLTNEIEEYEPTIIISTADKAFPAFLADYGNTNEVEIINVFDLKNDLYEDNTSLIQLLPPSFIYYEELANYIYENNRNRKLLTVGAEEEIDGIASELKKLYEDQYENISLENFGSFTPEIGENLLIYHIGPRKEEIADFFQALENIKEIYPGTDMEIIGRSNWSALIDEYGDKFSEFEIEVPTRVWLEEDSDDWKSFVEKYEEFFDGYPVRSIPNFAASGFDVADYFINVLNDNNGDFSSKKERNSYRSLQSDIKLKRYNDWGGMVNTSVYLLKFNSSGKIEKILIE